MAGEIDACKITPKDQAAYQKGLEFGHSFAEGGQSLIAEALKTYQVGKTQDQIASMYAGMSCADPTDIKLVRNGNDVNLRVDEKSELLVNEAFGWFNNFSTKPAQLLSKDAPANLDEAIRRTNEHFKREAGQYSADDAAVLAADFNRRRVENNWLPNVEAAVVDGQVIVRKAEK